MKKYIVAAFFLLQLATFSFGQENTDFVKSKFKGEVEASRFFARRIKYPISALKNNDMGRILIDFRINQKGMVDSIGLVSYFNKDAANQVIDLLLASRKMWTQTLINGKPESFVYKAVVNCRILDSGASRKSHTKSVCEHSKELENKGKHNKALKLLSKEIEKNPFSAALLKARAEVYNAINEQEKAQADIQQAEKITKEVLVEVNVNAYKRVSTTVFM